MRNVLYLLLICIFLSGCSYTMEIENKTIPSEVINFTYFKLSEPVEDDLRFPSEIIKVQGASNTPEVTIFGLAFDNNIMEQAYIIAQMPHSRAKDSKVEPHFHWHTEDNSSGAVVWCLEYRWANINEAFSSPISKCVVDESVNNSQIHLISNMIELNGTNKTLSSIIKGRLFRNATSPLDTYNGDAYLLEFDIHYYIDKLGENI